MRSLFKVTLLAPLITDADEFGAYLYGRFIVTPGTADADTTTCKIQMTRQFDN